MSTELICPECGGVIGGDATDQRKCTCFTQPPEKISDKDAPGPGKTVGKVCCKCGKDLTGKKRLRDSQGYWCYACHKLDQETHKPKGVKCGECGRLVAEAALEDYGGVQLCPTCRAERRRLAKRQRRFGKVKTDAYRRHEKRQMLWLLVVFAVLLLIIILQQLHRLVAPF